MTLVRVAGLALTLSPAGGIAAAVAVAGAAAGCVREPTEALCPAVEPGALVITEIRGFQDTLDFDGPWIEIYNASGRALDLQGSQLWFSEERGVLKSTALVRRSLPAEPDSYTVLGLFGDSDLPAHVDYGFFLVGAGKVTDPAWLAKGKIEVASCGALIDSVPFEPLPGKGSYSLGGVPDANRNDVDTSWCTDATQVGESYPGTPGNPNIGCP